MLSTSASLLHRARRMEAEAWDRLCLLYGPLIYSWCRRAGLQESDSADNTQEVLASVFQHFEQFDGREFRRWLWRIARNQIHLFFRQQKTPLARGGDGQELLNQLADRSLPEEEPDQPGDRRFVLIRALDLIQRDFTDQTWGIFTRTTLQTESYQEVAESLGISDNAVRQARFRVLRRLREELDGLL